MKYRIKEIENRAGLKKYYCQYQSSFLGIKIWLGLYYYNQELWDGIFAGDSYYTEYCNAINAIKYHKMFSNDKVKICIHEIND